MDTKEVKVSKGHQPLARRGEVATSPQVPETQKRYADYTVGDVIKGEEIGEIFYASAIHVIYRTTSGHLRYLVERSATSTPAVAAFERYGLEARRQLRGAYHNDLIIVFAACLNSALLASDDDPDKHFEPVQTFVRERGPIEYVYGYGSDFIVYLNKEGNVAFDHDGLSSRLISAAAEFQRLQHIANTSLEKSDQDVVRSILGSDLVSAFRSSGQVEPSELFLSSREFITNRSEALLRSRYVRSSVVSSIVFLIALLPLTIYLKYQSIPAWPILLGSVGGVVGAAISIIQRGVSLKVDPFVPLSHVVFQGTVRIILGVVFGALLVVAANAGLALGILAGNSWSLFIFSVVAGFSERFIPDILDRIAVEKHARSRQRRRKEEKPTL